MWETNGTVPRQDVLMQLCELFDVSIDYLLGNDKTDGNNPKNKKICSIQRLLDTLDESELDKAESILNTIFDNTFGGENHG
jgi:transcriptional regulator with XRE-family HTH domain